MDSLSQDSNSAGNEVREVNAKPGPADGTSDHFGGTTANTFELDTDPKFSDLGGRSLDPFSGGFSMKILEPMAKCLVPDPECPGSSCKSSLPDPGLMTTRSQTSLNEKVVPPAGGTRSNEHLEDVELMGLPSLMKPHVLPKMGDQLEFPVQVMASYKSVHTGLHAVANQSRFFFDPCTTLPATPEKENHVADGYFKFPAISKV